MNPYFSWQFCIERMEVVLSSLEVLRMIDYVGRI